MMNGIFPFTSTIFRPKVLTRVYLVQIVRCQLFRLVSQSPKPLERFYKTAGMEKKGREEKSLKVNMTKTILKISGPELNILRDSGKYPCVVSHKGVGSNAVPDIAQNPTSETDVMDKRDFAWFEFKMSFGGIFYIEQHPRLPMQEMDSRTVTERW